MIKPESGFTPPPLPARRDFIYNPPQSPLDILYQDSELLVVNKPSGLLSVPGKSDPDSLQTRLLAAYPEARLVHRLDLATSGVMIFARTAHAQRHLGLQFERRHTQKHYTAQVAGQIRGQSGRISLPLIADWPNRPRQMVSFTHGKAATTDWESISHKQAETTRLSLYPITGRSHQLRVHCWAIGHPILGDMIYATDKAFKAADRLQLHAEALSLRHPDGGERVSFKAECPF